jgi:hypothetical protein
MSPAKRTLPIPAPGLDVREKRAALLKPKLAALAGPAAKRDMWVAVLPDRPVAKLALAAFDPRPPSRRRDAL